MAIIKCKMCGGDLNIEEGASVAECEYCGSRQTVPNQDNEKKLTLFGRANRLRLACEFDKAAGVYESIVADFPEEAEAYWGLVLCRYGIEYVDDPRTGKKIPTCHRSSFDSVMEDQDFEQACENADAVARKVYREEAKAIEELRRGILEVSGKEASYDIFICYKETDDKGDRTIDSVIAQDVYDALTEKGYRVFFSRISLEDKLGTEYEPYIFAALNSAKIMLAFGTDYEYFNAVWVKNEWSRFLALIASGQKKTLIPCYKGIDAYDMPKEFARLQAQDMGKVGAIQDLLRGIEKILSPKKKKTVEVEQQGVSTNPAVISLLESGYDSLADEKFDEAEGYFDEALKIESKNGDAYAGKLCVEMEFQTLEEMATYPTAWRIPGRKLKGWTKEEINEYYPEGDAQSYLDKALTYGSSELKKKLIDFATKAIEAVRQDKKEGEQRAKQKAQEAKQKAVYHRPLIEKCCKWNILACGDGYYVGLRSDGTVVATGMNGYGQCNVDNWRDIIAVACGWLHTVGLCANGTVVATGDNRYGQCNVSDWRDIVAISCGVEHTVGLCANGKVVVTGNKEFQDKVNSWENITSVDMCGKHLVGLRADGTVEAAVDTNRGSGTYPVPVLERDNANFNGRCNVKRWKNIVAVYSGEIYAAGLCADGTVITTGMPDSKSGLQVGINANNWKNIIALACTRQYIVGLHPDGTIAGADFVTNAFEDWLHDIVAVVVGRRAVFCLRADGTVISTNLNLSCDDHEKVKDIVAIACYRDNTGSFSGNPCAFGVRADGTAIVITGEVDLDGWKLFDDVDQLDRDMTERVNKGKEERIRNIRTEKSRLEKRCSDLQNELANLKGLFTGKRRQELEALIADTNDQIQKLSLKLK